MTRFLGYFLVVLSFSAFGQSQSLRIFDENNRALQGAVAINYLGQEFGPSNTLGLIKLPPTAGSQLQIFKEGYFIKRIELNWERVEENLVSEIRLQKNDIELLTVEVSAERVPFTDTLRVLDFEIQDSLLLVLGYDYIVLANLNWDVLLYLQNKADFEALEKDPRGHIFFLHQDSVVQAFLNEEMLYFYPAISRDDYRQYIEPIVAAHDGRLILRNNKIESMPIPISATRAGDRGKAMTFPLYHNQGVQMFLYEKNHEPIEFYYSVDTQAVVYAHDAFMEAFEIAKRIEFIFDEYGILDHRKLLDLNTAQNLYQNGFSKYRPTQVFPYEEGFILFDQFIDKVRYLRVDGSLVWEKEFVIDKEFINPIIIQDLTSNALFALRKKRGSVFVHPLHDFQLGSGFFVELFAKETKVRGDELYFINESNYLVRKKMGQ